jgi:hypothetical protein
MAPPVLDDGFNNQVSGSVAGNAVAKVRVAEIWQ